MESRVTPKLPYPAAVVLLGAVYFGVANVGLVAAVAHGVVSSAWPPAGLALAALLLYGVRYWPGVTLGAVLLNATTGVPLSGAAGIGIGNTLEAVTGALLLTRVARFRPSLERLKDVLALVVLAGVVSTVISAAVGVTSLWLSGAIGPSSLGPLGLVWWSGDAIGVLIVTPALLSWIAAPVARVSVPRAVEALTLLLILVVLTDALFQTPFSYVYAIFPVVSWAALRFGLRGAATASLLVTTLAVWYTLQGRGPFVGSTPTHNLALLQTFIGLLAVTTLVLTALMTERKSAEQALAASEEHYRLLFERNPNPLYVYDERSLAFLAVNDMAVHQYGYSREEFLQLTLDDIRPPDEVPRLHQRLAQLGKGLVEAGEWRHRRKDGTIVDVEITRHTLTFAGRPAGLVMALEITKRRQAEEALRGSQARFAGIVDIADDAIISVDESQRIQLFNQGAAKIFGYTAEEVVGQPLDILLPPRFIEAHGRHLQEFAQSADTARRMGERREVFGRRKDGKEFPAEASISRLRLGSDTTFTVILRDISGRKSLETQLLQAQKMEAVGRLAGGVAHDFNNLLTIIFGSSDALLESLSADDAHWVEVEEIAKAARRAASLTHQLLAFSRRQVLEPQLLDLNALVTNLEEMLRRLIGEDVEFRTVLTPAPGAVLADPGQLEQVIMNLAVNARDAMPQGGKLTIETAAADLDDFSSQANVPVRPGSYMMLAVSDTGAGMDAETKAHLFEPFFTTKEKGKGTGLGLATVYGIVKQSGGYVWVYSEPGRGATFKIYLPQVEATSEPLPPKATPVSLRGSETILVVEDEEGLRSLLRKVLEARGYVVLAAGGGDEALRLGNAYDGVIHLLVTDVVMPGMSGRELAERMVSVRPETKVLYISGYTDNAIVHHGVLKPGIAFLQKPFTPRDLVRKLREVLDAG